MPSGPSPKHARALRCMEIWGGSEAVEETVAMPGLDAWVFSRPHHEAAGGGDVHYVSLCGGGIITRVIVADVSGHGAEVAAFGRSLRDLMRRHINRKSQLGLVRALNRQFAALAGQRRFATAVVATYLAGRRRLSVCNAGHPRPLWYRAAERRWAPLDREVGEPEPGANLPLGLDDATAYQPFAVTLGPGDRVVFYTDALIEAADGGGRMLGEEGLRGLAEALPADDDPLAVGPRLLAAVDAHRGGEPADDDTTLLVLHHNGGGPRRAGLAETLDIYAKVFHLRSV